jgi:hypothetical protein
VVMPHSLAITKIDGSRLSDTVRSCV